MKTTGRWISIIAVSLMLSATASNVAVTQEPASPLSPPQWIEINKDLALELIGKTDGVWVGRLKVRDHDVWVTVQLEDSGPAYRLLDTK